MYISYDEYQVFTRRTAGCDELPVLALGLVGESIEFLSAFEALQSLNADTSLVDMTDLLTKEAGDILWYCARILDVIDTRFESWYSRATVDNFNDTCTERDRRFRILEHVAIVTEHIKKVYGHGHDMDTDLIHMAISNVTTDVVHIAKAVHGKFGPETVMRKNIEKLRKRYPEGFSTERSVNRNSG